MPEKPPPPGNLAPPAVRPVHGGLQPAHLRALGLRREQVLDFSASVSPIGPPAGVWDALRQVDLAAYPDPQCLELRETLAGHLNGLDRLRGRLTPDHILVGNGSTEIIHLVARAYLPPPGAGAGNTVLLLTPTYGEYSGACRLAGAAISCFDASASAGFRWDLAQAARRIREERPSLVFLCNPNNPTGVFLEQGEVQTLARACAAVGGLLVIDEAYISFVDHPGDSLGLALAGPALLVRSMTKDYALTGLRLGYALASEDIIRRLAVYQPDWSVNGLAQAAGRAALADTGYLVRAKRAVNQAKEYLAAGLAGLGFTVHPSNANFLLVRAGDGALWQASLMGRGIFVRDCTSFGLREYIRIGIRSLADCRRLVAAVAELSGQSSPPPAGP